MRLLPSVLISQCSPRRVGLGCAVHLSGSYRFAEKHIAADTYGVSFSWPQTVNNPSVHPQWNACKLVLFPTMEYSDENESHLHIRHEGAQKRNAKWKKPDTAGYAMDTPFTHGPKEANRTLECRAGLRAGRSQNKQGGDYCLGQQTAVRVPYLQAPI